MEDITARIRSLVLRFIAAAIVGALVTSLAFYWGFLK